MLGTKEAAARVISKERGSVTVEACISFPVFLCFFMVLIFFIRLACIEVALSHAANETAKQLAANAYPIKFLNQLEDEVFLDSLEYKMPAFSEECKKIKSTILKSSVEGTENIFSTLISGGNVGKEKLRDISKDLLKNSFSEVTDDLKLGVKSYIAHKLGSSFYEVKSKIKYASAKALTEKFLEGSYIKKENLEYTFVQLPQSVIEYNIRAKDETYIDICKSIGYTPERDDVVIALRYKVRIPIPLFADREIVIDQIGVEKGWINGSNGVFSLDHYGEGDKADKDSEGNEAALEDSYRELGDETVFITSTGGKYHKEDCPCLSSSKIPIKLADAEGRGYSKCKVCSNKGKWNFY